MGNPMDPLTTACTCYRLPCCIFIAVTLERFLGHSKQQICTPQYGCEGVHSYCLISPLKTILYLLLYGLFKPLYIGAGNIQLYGLVIRKNLKQRKESNRDLSLILRRSRTGTVWFCTSTSNKRAARPKLYTKTLTRDLKRMYSRLTLVRISIKL